MVLDASLLSTQHYKVHIKDKVSNPGNGVAPSHYPFPWIAHFSPDTYFIKLSVKQGGIKYYFLSLWYDLA